MTRPSPRKSTIEEIRARFDADVERFSNLETGQQAAMDAALALELIAGCAAATTPGARDLLDVGCGAGNYTLKLLFQLPDLNCTLLDLSQPMLDRAVERVSTATTGRVVDAQGDVRQFDFQPNSLDLIVAGSVLHHLRSEEEWRAVFAGFHTALRPGGSVWVFDLVESSTAPVGAQMQQRYGEYLVQLKGEDYRDTVFEYIAQEDTPKSLVEQLDLLREVGFAHLEILHKTACFATFGASKEG